MAAWAANAGATVGREERRSWMKYLCSNPTCQQDITDKVLEKFKDEEVGPLGAEALSLPLQPGDDVYVICPHCSTRSSFTFRGRPR
jgi:hypothetical protein